jgi:hypothetical protein
MGTASGAALPDNFSYSVRIGVPLHEKFVVASGFYLQNQTSVYMVTARHVLFGPTQVQLGEGASVPIPRHLAYRFRLDKKSRLLIFDGVLSVQERDDMLMHPSMNDGGRVVVQVLYEKSQKLRLRAHTANVITCEPGTGEFELGLTRMLIKDLIKYHPVRDVAVMKLGTVAMCGAAPCTNFVEEVRVKKTERVNALDLGRMKLIDAVAAGEEVFVPGYAASAVVQPSLERRPPTLRKSVVAGIRKDVGAILIRGTARPGDSGGLVVEVDQNADQAHFKGVGIVSARLQYERGSEDPKEYSLAVGLDALMELLN